MNAWNVTGGAVRAVALAAALAGCGGSQIGTPAGGIAALPYAAEGPVPLHVGKLDGEAFSATKISAKCEQSYSSMHFAAKGKATGPFPGTFKVSGLLTRNSDSHPAGLSETFVIHSGAQTIEGEAKASGRKISLNCVYLTFSVAKAFYKADGSHGRTQLEYGYPSAFDQEFR